jgi:small GTP-binding protein
MGSVFSSCLPHDRQHKILILGLTNSGKTTTMMRIMNLITGQDVDFESIPSTLGQNIGRIRMFGKKCVIFDLGGQDAYRARWSTHFDDTRGLVFVLDGADPAKFEAAHASLNAVLASPHTAHCPVLLLINKSDLPECTSFEHVVEFFGLDGHRWSRDRPFRVLRVSALHGDSVYTSFRWLVRQMGVKPDAPPAPKEASPLTGWQHASAAWR